MFWGALTPELREVAGLEVLSIRKGLPVSALFTGC